MKEAGLEKVATTIINSGAVEIRDIDGGEEPFVYSTGNRGPGYLMIKGLVGQRKVLKYLTKELAKKIAPLYRKSFDFIEGNATGGMIPAWQLTDDVEKVLDLEVGSIPYCYLRGSRKEGGHGELITGNRNNPLIKGLMRALIFEELVNYAGTTGNAADEFRAAGYPVSHAACILSYDHAQSNARLKEKGVTLIPLITLPQLLDISEANKLIPANSIQSYKDFLTDPLEWQLSRNLVIPGGIPDDVDLLRGQTTPKDSAKAAIERGYNIRELGKKEAVQMGAPEEKVWHGDIVYWAQEQ